jgi:hypothetical protein
MKRVVKKLAKKLAPQNTDDLLEAEPAFARVVRAFRFDPRGDGRAMKEWIAIADPKAAWLALAREAYRFVRTGK